MEKQREFGALGNWKKINETFDDSIIKQSSDASCVAAVGEMLAKLYGLNVSQSEILEAIGVWANAGFLADFLNSKETGKDVEWIGRGFPVEPRFISGIVKSTPVWAAMLRDGEVGGHAVLIYGADENGLILIKDPFDQSKYKMKKAELFRVLSEFVLRRKKK